MFSIILLFLAISVGLSILNFQIADANALCIDFIPLNKTLRLTCGSAMLTDIYNATRKYKDVIPGFDSLLEKAFNNGIWFLKVNLVIDSNSSFIINSTDTRWLKIYSDGKEAYSIKVYGSMEIDSVKITSWNPKENDYYKNTKKDSSDRRAFISVMGEATGTTNITNSELAYLGYNSSRESKHVPSNGLSYYDGEGSIIKGNNLHNNNFGFYSADVGNLLIDSNRFHHNTYYGMDPHSGTHDMIIRNNTVYDNGKQGIICSQRCRNITIEDNEVYNNVASGISFSIDMQDSIVRNNFVYNQQNGSTAISVSESSNNRVYGNKVSFSDVGIKVTNNSSNNYIYSNTFAGIENYGILVRGANSVNNMFENNEINGSSKAVRLYNNTDSSFINNHLYDINSGGREYLVQANSTLNLGRTMFPIKSKIISDDSTNNMINIVDSGMIKLKDGTGKITDIDTEMMPFSSRIYGEAFSIISANSTFAKLR
jgi:poly(beta-D-mannuronate) C5 epimerase